MTLRRATLDDLALMIRVDLEDEGVNPAYRNSWGEKELAAHREQMAGFLLDSDKGSLIADSDAEPSIGLVMWRMRDLTTETVAPASHFHEIEAALPPSGVFCEIFQLWVAPTFRRQGIGTSLKLAVEDVARDQGMEMIYTHTEERNLHVLALNHKLGYREVRRGLLWDDEIRVSLVKDLR